MGQAKHEFQEILENILERETPRPQSKNSEISYENHNFFLQPDEISPLRPLVNSVYPQKTKPSRFNLKQPKQQFSLKFEDLNGNEKSAAELLFKSAHKAIPKHLCESEVKSAFRQVAKRYHPDARIGSNDRDQQTLSLAFAQCNRAYRQLIKALRNRGQTAA